MNGWAENGVSDASERPERGEVVLNLGTARKMLPLVERIVAEIVAARARVDRLTPERDALDEGRRSLSWPQRQRRYEVHDELAAVEQELRDAVGELEELGVAMLDERRGRVGLPTVVNGRLAYFSWQTGEAGIRCWHFPGEMVRRLIPTSWKETGEVRLPGKA